MWVVEVDMMVMFKKRLDVNMQGIDRYGSCAGIMDQLNLAPCSTLTLCTKEPVPDIYCSMFHISLLSCFICYKVIQ